MKGLHIHTSIAGFETLVYVTKIPAPWSDTVYCLVLWSENMHLSPIVGQLKSFGKSLLEPVKEAQ